MHPRRGNQPPNVHRIPPRPSTCPRKPAGTVSRRPPYSNFARTCKVATKSGLFFWTVHGPFSFRARPIRGPRRAPRGGERRSKGAGTVFAAGGNGAQRTLGRRHGGCICPAISMAAYTVAALRFPSPGGAANRAASSKPPRFIRRWRRFGDFPRPMGRSLPLRRNPADFQEKS